MAPPAQKEDDNSTTDASHTTPPPRTKAQASNITMATGSEGIKEPMFPQVKFSHVQLYVDHVDSLETYKNLERNLQDFAAAQESRNSDGTMSLEEKRHLWLSISNGKEKVKPFSPQNRDIIKQMMTGFGMRVTGAHQGCRTSSFLLTTKDPSGVQVVVTAKDGSSVVREEFPHFQEGKIQVNDWIDT
jgi:hypothetical protein